VTPTSGRKPSDFDLLNSLQAAKDAYTPAWEIYMRIAAFQQALAEASLDAALIKQNVDLYYLTGTMQDSYLYVPVEGEPTLMVYRNRDRAAVESPLKNVVQLTSLRKIPDLIRDNGSEIPGTLGLELDVLPVALYFRLQRVLNTELADISQIIRNVRKKKTDYEIVQIRRAGEIAHAMYEKAKSILAPGMTEIEAQGLLEAEARRLGHPGIIRMRSFNQEMFYGHLISGPEAIPPSTLDAPTGGVGLTPAFSHGPGYKKLRTGESVNVDLIGNYNGYVADQTRCMCLGDPGHELTEYYDIVTAIYGELVAMIAPGTKAADLFSRAYELAELKGVADIFMGLEGSRPKFIGHGVGLEADEFPFITASNDERLAPGMVFALEPKLFVPHIGVVGIEDTALVTNEGAEFLTVSPRDLTVIAPNALDS